MTDTTTTTSPPATTSLTWGTAARWMATFTAFPLGSVAARALAGPVDSTVPALTGGLVNGLILGAAQFLALGRVRPPAVPWIAATGVGMSAGLALAASLVGYATDPRSLVVQGAVTGAAVGLAQAVVLARTTRSRALALVWPLLVAASWALGWAVTSAVGVDVGMRFTVFGSSGAVVVAALTLALPAILHRDSQGVRS